VGSRKAGGLGKGLGEQNPGHDRVAWEMPKEHRI
jgi:hypothetical protein